MAWIGVLAAIALLIGWMASRTGPQGTDAIRPPERVRAADRPIGGTPPSAPRALPPGARASETPDAPEDIEKTYEGRGTIRGQVQVREGLEFPEHWQLVLEPARFLEGSERAVSRVVEIADGAREFEVNDLPLGGYDVFARAEGMNGLRQPVLLYKFKDRDDLPGATHTYLNLWLTPAGFVDGSVVDEAGIPVADLTVTLKSTRAKRSLETRTDPSGNYLFPVVLDDEYEIFFGDPARPLRAPERFTFTAPSMRYPERRIPTAVDVTFRVFDELGYAVPDASIRGYADAGGTIDLVTDADGEARTRFLPVGTYRVTAKGPAGKRGKSNFETRESERTKVVEIVVKS